MGEPGPPPWGLLCARMPPDPLAGYIYIYTSVDLSIKWTGIAKPSTRKSMALPTGC